MATHSRPFMNKGVALASAAAIAAATPAIMPTLDVPTHALATAEVQLANFADVLSVPAEAWTDILFSNTTYGGFLSATNYGPEWAAPQTVALQPGYVNPWAYYCTDSKGNGSCTTSGISGVAYLFLDALINGDGSGYENTDNWKIGIVNYLFEPSATFVIGGGNSPTLQFVQAGVSAATWFALQGTLGQLVPALTVPIAAVFQGEYNVSVAYNLALSVVALALSSVPLIGPFAGNSVLAYLGDLVIPGTEPTPTNPDGPLYYQFGLSGTLNYWIDIATGSVPFPTTAVPPGSASLAAAAAPVEAAAALVSATASATSTALKGDVAEVNPAAAREASTAVEAVDATPAATPAVEVADATPAVEVAESSPAAEAPESVATPAADLPAAEVADTAPVKAPKRPVRSAVERVAKSVQSALGVTKADTAGRDAVSPGSAAGAVGSGANAAESSSSDAGSADNDASPASSDVGSADNAG